MDLGFVDGLAAQGAAAGGVKRLREKHHRLARALALGQTPTEAGLCCGYTPARVHQLKADPSFQELLAYYAAKEELVFESVVEKLRDVAELALGEIATRLEDEPEALTFGQLIDAASLTLDRSGHGPKQTVQSNVNISVLSQETLDELRSRHAPATRPLPTGATREPVLLDATPNPSKLYSPGAPERDEGAGEDVREEGGEGIASLRLVPA